MANGHVKVDPEALRSNGEQLRTSAGVIGQKRDKIKEHSFTGEQAGRGYTGWGGQVGQSLWRLGIWLDNWSTAMESSGSGMVGSAKTYKATDDENVTKYQAVPDPNA